MAVLSDLADLNESSWAQSRDLTHFHQTWLDRHFPPFDPFNIFRILWEVIGGVLIVWTCFYVPVNLVLLEEPLNPSLQALEMVVFVFFSLDILVNFNTAFFASTSGELVHDRKRIVKRFVYGWFWIDVVSTFPWDFLDGSQFASSAQLLRILRIMKVLRIVKMLRILKLKDVVHKVFGVVSLRVRLLAQVMCLMLSVGMISHWTSCVWCGIQFWTAVQEEPNGSSWRFEGVEAQEMSPGDRYAAAFYHSLLSLTVGPSSELTFDAGICYFVQGFCCLLNVCVMCSIVGLLSNVVMEYNVRDGEIMAKTMAMASFMREKQVDKHTQHKVISYIRRASKHAELESNSKAVETLSPALHREVAYFVVRAPFSKFVFFDWLGETFLRSIAARTQSQLLGPHELIMQQGYRVFSMVFLVSGEGRCFRLQTSALKRANSSHWVETLKLLPHDIEEGSDYLLEAGDYHEDSMWALLAQEHVAYFTVLTNTFCEVLEVPRGKFDEVLQLKPEWVKALEEFRSLDEGDRSQLRDAVRAGDAVLLSRLSKGSRSQETEVVQEAEEGRRNQKRKWQKSRSIFKSARDAFQRSASMGYSGARPSQAAAASPPGLRLGEMPTAHIDDAGRVHLNGVFANEHGHADAGHWHTGSVMEQQHQSGDVQGFRSMRIPHAEAVILESLMHLQTEVKENRTRTIILEHRLGHHSDAVAGAQPESCPLCAEAEVALRTGSPHGDASVRSRSSLPCCRDSTEGCASVSSGSPAVHPPLRLPRPPAAEGPKPLLGAGLVIQVAQEFPGQAETRNEGELRTSL